MAAGTIVQTHTGNRGSLECLSIAWTAGTDAAAGTVAATISRIEGTIEKIVFVPGTTTTQPDDNYDVTLSDQDGFDVLRGKGANLDEATNTEHDCITGTPVYHYPTMGLLTLAISGAGASNTGTIRVFFRR